MSVTDFNTSRTLSAARRRADVNNDLNGTSRTFFPSAPQSFHQPPPVNPDPSKGNLACAMSDKDIPHHGSQSTRQREENPPQRCEYPVTPFRLSFLGFLSWTGMPVKNAHRKKSLSTQPMSVTRATQKRGKTTGGNSHRQMSPARTASSRPQSPSSSWYPPFPWQSPPVIPCQQLPTHPPLLA